ncbi:MAG: PaaI family thioesterase [Methylobacteriaceae bacterium]|nr:PaaI family thioesterase [Methylobacteriaceae bacterium]
MSDAASKTNQHEESRPDIFGAHIPFVHFCGIEPVSSEPGRTRLRVKLEDHHMNQLGIAHGGVTMTLIDVALGTAARSGADKSAVMTLDIQTQFISPGRGTLEAEGRIVKAGRSLVFVEADVHDEEGTLVAKASGVFKAARSRQPAEDRSDVQA